VDPIRLIRDKAELQGTCYVELLPGQFRGECWNNGSVFLAEDVFGLVEPIIERYEPRFDHYAFVDIGRHVWQKITADMERLATRAETALTVDDLRGEVCFIFAPTEAEFARNFRANADALARLAREMAGWVQDQLRRHECVSILGM
jgi:hypothetical protein